MDVTITTVIHSAWLSLFILDVLRNCSDMGKRLRHVGGSRENDIRQGHEESAEGCCVRKRGMSRGTRTPGAALGMGRRGPRPRGQLTGLAAASVLFLTLESLNKDHYLVPELFGDYEPNTEILEHLKKKKKSQDPAMAKMYKNSEEKNERWIKSVGLGAKRLR